MKRRLKTLCTIGEQKNQLGLQSKEGATVARKNFRVGRKPRVDSNSRGLSLSYDQLGCKVWEDKSP